MLGEGESPSPNKSFSSLLLGVILLFNSFWSPLGNLFGLTIAPAISNPEEEAMPGADCELTKCRFFLGLSERLMV